MRPDARRRLAWLALLALPLVFRDDLSRLALARVAAFALAATGISVVSGLCGQISLGHAALMAAGGFTSAGLAEHGGWPVLAAMPAGVAVAVAAGLALGVPSLRLRGQYLALATLGGGFIVYQVIRQDPGRWTGGDLGLGRIPPPSLAGYTFGPFAVSLVALGGLAAALFLAANLAGSRTGRAFRAVRDAEAGAEASGISLYRAKLGAFLISAALAGAGGALLAHADGFIVAGDFDPRASLLLVLAAVLGGFRSAYGGAIGALALLGPTELLPRAFSWLDQYRLVAWGPVALLVIVRWPDGIAGGVTRTARRLRARWAASTSPAPAVARAAGLEARVASAAVSEPRVAKAALAPRGETIERGAVVVEARGVRKRYGGLVALDGVDLIVRAGTIHALIGPNGSGKTTLLDALGGFGRPDAGTVTILGHRADRWPADRIAALGVGRTFQSVAVFGGMTAVENVLAGAHPSLHGGLARGVLGLRAPDPVHAPEILEASGLGGRAGTLASALSYGERKRLELARALAARPPLLLLDEPAAGRSEGEILDLGRTLLRLRAAGFTILLVEHHMNFVLSIADTVTALDEGRVIAEGSPAAVRTDPRVIAAYLGEGVA